MSEFSGTYVMMPVKVICKECEHCERLEVEIDQDVQLLSSGEKLVENDMRCRNLGQCIRIYQTMKKWEPDREKAQIEKEGGGSSWWDVCTECHGAVDSQDRYCKHCGAQFIKKEQG